MAILNFILNALPDDEELECLENQWLKNMESIFHEKQEGQLCAQHALNVLLQGSYFTAVDLASFAQQLDDEERRQMAEAGEQSDEYKRFLAEGSSNMDDSGFFSVQVIARALKVWGLDLVPFKSQSSIAEAARLEPVSQKAYICNLQQHWFALRKIGRQWFNLNSLLSGPELVSDTYLSLLLTQLEQEGYSIFVVNGILPDCEADHVLSTKLVTQPVKPSLVVEPRAILGGPARGADGFTDDERTLMAKAIQDSLASTLADEQQQMQAALALSLGGNQATERNPFMTEDEEMEAAIRLSLEKS
ncbi:Ataxin-3 [Halotydeus destructor]|nr:Ataxin-3 [Halotydeus destructor]